MRVRVGDKVIFNGRKATIQYKLYDGQLYDYAFTFDDDIHKMIYYAYDYELTLIKN